MMDIGEDLKNIMGLTPHARQEAKKTEPGAHAL
jgi:hypothetical protein